MGSGSRRTRLASCSSTGLAWTERASVRATAACHEWTTMRRWLTSVASSLLSSRPSLLACGLRSLGSSTLPPHNSQRWGDGRRTKTSGRGKAEGGRKEGHCRRTLHGVLPLGCSPNPSCAVLCCAGFEYPILSYPTPARRSASAWNLQRGSSIDCLRLRLPPAASLGRFDLPFLAAPSSTTPRKATNTPGDSSAGVSFRM